MFVPLIIFIAIASFIALVVFNYKNPRFNNPSTQKSGKLYRGLFNTSAFILICCTLFFATLIALDNYNLAHLKNFGKGYSSFSNSLIALIIPTQILWIAIMLSCFIKLKTLKAHHNPKTIVSILIITLRILQVLIGIICMLGAWFTVMFGFGNMLND